jgi:hypothetical protein
MLTKPLTLLLNLRFILILGLVFLGPYSYAQTEKTPATNEIQEEHDTQNLNNLLIEYNKKQEALKKSQEGRDSNPAKAFENDSSEEEMAKALDKMALHKPKKTKALKELSEFKDLNYSESLRVALAPLQKLSEKELSKLLLDNTKGTSAEKYIARFPKLILFCVRLIKDKVAIPNLVKILEDQKRLVRFAATMLTTILLSFFLKYLLKKEGRAVWKAVVLWFLRFFIITTLRVGVITYFFNEELGPAFKIGIKLLFSE